MSLVNKIVIAKLNRPNGLNGEMRIAPYTNDRDKFLKYSFFYLDDKKVKPEYYRKTTKSLIVKLESVSNRTEASLLSGKLLYIEREQIEDAEILLNDYIGLTTYLPDDTMVGKITAYYDVGIDGFFEIATEKGKKLIPCTSEYWEVPDLSKKKVTLKDTEGLLNYD